MGQDALTSLPGSPTAVVAATPARRSAGSTSIETPVRRYLAASESGTPQITNPLNTLIFDLLNPNASAKGADKAHEETDDQIQKYLRARLPAHQTFISIPILEYIQAYAESMMADPDGLYRYGGVFAKDLLTQQGTLVTDTNGTYKYTPTIKLPQGEDQEATAEHMRDLYVGLFNRLFRNTAIALQVFKETVPSARIDRSAVAPAAPKRTTKKIVSKKLSPWKKVKRNWKHMHAGWKVAACLTIALCIVGVAAAAILCPPSLAVTIPVAGKIALSTAAMGAAATIATTTAIGHSIHIAKSTPRKTIDLPAADAGDKTDDAKPELSGKIRTDLHAAIEKTVTDLIVAETNSTLAARAHAARAQRAQQREAAAAASPPHSGRLTPPPGTPAIRTVRGALVFGDTPERKNATHNPDTSTATPPVDAGFCDLGF